MWAQRRGPGMHLHRRHGRLSHNLPAGRAALHGGSVHECSEWVCRLRVYRQKSCGRAEPHTRVRALSQASTAGGDRWHQLTLKPQRPSSPCRPADCTCAKHRSCRVPAGEAAGQQLGCASCVGAAGSSTHADRRGANTKCAPAAAQFSWPAYLIEQQCAVAWDVAQAAAVQCAHL